ncbi:MAG: YeeE/YedE thiosulfate transporter family protein, partial [Burkholderiales bacterium]
MRLAADIRAPSPAQPVIVIAAGAIAVALGAAVLSQGLRMLALLALGMMLGATLYLSSFGFTSAYRRLLEKRDVAGIRAQLIMLAAATLLFAPVLAHGSWFGREIAGALAPAGVQVAAGAFLFGIGMQLAGGCGSGAL